MEAFEKRCLEQESITGMGIMGIMVAMGEMGIMGTLGIMGKSQIIPIIPIAIPIIAIAIKDLDKRLVEVRYAPKGISNNIEFSRIAHQICKDDGGVFARKLLTLRHI